jgi:hypothetical protein
MICKVFLFFGQRGLCYLFSGLFDLTGPLERTFVLPFSAATAAIRVSALGPPPHLSSTLMSCRRPLRPPESPADICSRLAAGTIVLRA